MIGEKLAEDEEDSEDESPSLFHTYVREMRVIKELERAKQMAEGVAVLRKDANQRQESLETVEILDMKIELARKDTVLPFLCAPVTAGLDDALKNNKIFVQAYHGRAFVSNHCHRYLKLNVFTDVCNSVVRNTLKTTDSHHLHGKADDICLKFKTLNELFSKAHEAVSHTEALRNTGTSFQEISNRISNYMQFFRTFCKCFHHTQATHVRMSCC